MSESLDALKRMYEHLDVDLNYDEYAYEIADKDFETIKKELKALEIIKEKKVDVGELLESDTLADYNETVFVTYPNKRVEKEYNPYSYLLAQEEYDLLKEVLL